MDNEIVNLNLDGSPKDKLLHRTSESMYLLQVMYSFDLKCRHSDYVEVSDYV
jgi:hypothetical protein